MMAFVVLVNVIFWSGVLYWLYKKNVEPTVKKYKDASEGVEIARKFGGLEKIYNNQVSFFEDAGFRIVSSSDKSVKFEKKENNTVSEIEMMPASTEEAIIHFYATYIDGKSIEFEVSTHRRDKSLQQLYESLCEYYLYACADKNSSSSWETRENFIIEGSLGREKIYSLRWEHLADQLNQESKEIEEIKIKIIREWLIPTMVYPQRFFENARYLAAGGYSDGIFTIDKNVSKSVEDFVWKASGHEHVRLPIWFISALPDLSLRLAEEEADQIFGSDNTDQKKDVQQWFDSLLPENTIDTISKTSGKKFDLKESGGGLLDSSKYKPFLKQYRSHLNFEASITFQNTWNKNPNAEQKIMDAYLL